ncbi:MAG: CoA transferase [Pseudomonadota bacterium]
MAHDQTRDQEHQGPYHGIRVVELGRFIAAPYCGQLLADGGADVIKIEPLDGDDARQNGTRLSATEARQFLNKNRGKRSIALKLSDPDACRAVRDLIIGADVVITNFRPGQGEKLGLDYDTIRADNPAIIYAENSAFGAKGPLAGKAGMDLLLLGYTGLAPFDQDGPTALVDPIIDYTAALLMSWGVATALFHRERTGIGQKLDVSLLQAALVLQNNSLNHVDIADEWRHDFVAWLKQAFSEGQSLADILAHRQQLKPAIQPAYYGFFETKDSYIAIAAGGHGLRVRTAKLLGIDDPSLNSAEFTPDDIAAFTASMREKTQTALRQKTTTEWISLFEAEGLAAGEVQLKDQVLDDEQCWANNYFTRVTHDDLGDMTVVAPPVKFSESPLSGDVASPVLGSHSMQILTEAGLTEEKINQLVATGAVRLRQSKD